MTLSSSLLVKLRLALRECKPRDTVILPMLGRAEGTHDHDQTVPIVLVEPIIERGEEPNPRYVIDEAETLRRIEADTLVVTYNWSELDVLLDSFSGKKSGKEVVSDYYIKR